MSPYKSQAAAQSMDMDSCSLYRVWTPAQRHGTLTRLTGSKIALKSVCRLKLPYNGDRRLPPQLEFLSTPLSQFEHGTADASRATLGALAVRAVTTSLKGVLTLGRLASSPAPRTRSVAHREKLTLLCVRDVVAGSLQHARRTFVYSGAAAGLITGLIRCVDQAGHWDQRSIVGGRLATHCAVIFLCNSGLNPSGGNALHDGIIGHLITSFPSPGRAQRTILSTAFFGESCRQAQQLRYQRRLWVVKWQCSISRF